MSDAAKYYQQGSVWVRVGDDGAYESFDLLYDALEYLNALGVGGVTGWVVSPIGVGVETVNYWGFDFISLFWGDEQANLIRELDGEERLIVESELIEVLI